MRIRCIESPCPNLIYFQSRTARRAHQRARGGPWIAYAFPFGSLIVPVTLAGARINVHDCLFAGAATHYVQTHRIEKLQKALTDADVNSSDDQLLAIVDDFAVGERERRLMQENAHVSAADPGRNDASYYQRYALNGVTDPTHLETHLEAINACFGQPSIEEVHLVGVCVRACVRVCACFDTSDVLCVYLRIYINMCVCVCVCARALCVYIHAPMCMCTRS